MYYLDNAATTRVSEAAAEAAMAAMRDCYANPSSLHSAGQEAAALLKKSRASVAALLGCAPDCVTFTAGGTEGNNTVLHGVLQRNRHQGKHVITTAVEHPAVRATLKAMALRGECEVTWLQPDRDGKVTAKQVEEALREDTVLVSVMHVNNETGAVMPIREIAGVLKRNRSRAKFHCDGVQAFGKPGFMRPAALGVDFYTVSGHKLHAPKGVGALYLREGVRIPPYITGGGQEKNMRSGTEALPAIAGFGVACSEALARSQEAEARIEALNARLDAGLAALPQVVRTFRNCPWIAPLSVPGGRAEVVMRILDDRGVCVSTGSACSKGVRSEVLEACGLEKRLLDGSIRVSFSAYNTEEDIDALLEGLREACERLLR